MARGSGVAVTVTGRTRKTTKHDPGPRPSVNLSILRSPTYVSMRNNQMGLFIRAPRLDLNLETPALNVSHHTTLAAVGL